MIKKKNKHNRFIINKHEIPIFIISLKNDLNRRKKLLKFLPSNIVDNYFHAVDMRKKSQFILDSYCNKKKLYKNYKRKLKPGEVGAAISHRQVYEQIVKKKFLITMILEDDVVLKFKNWQKKLSQILDEMSYINFKKAVICNLGVSNLNFRRKKIIIKRKLPKFLKKISILDLKKSNQKLAHAYLITYSAAKNILDKNKRINCVADHWKFYDQQNCFDFFLVSEQIFTQNKNFISHIQEPIKKKKLSEINKNFYTEVLKILKFILYVFYKWFNPKIILGNKN